MFAAPLNSRTFLKVITKNSDKRPAAAFAKKAAAGLLSKFFVMAVRNILLFRGAVNILDFCIYDFFRKRDCRIINTAFAVFERGDGVNAPACKGH